jgi:hypothetical protein
VKAAALFDHAPDRRGRGFEGLCHLRLCFVAQRNSKSGRQGQARCLCARKIEAFWADSLPGSQAQDLLQHQLRLLLVTFQWHHGAQEFRLLCRPSRMRVSLPSTLLAARKQANAG